MAAIALARAGAEPVLIDRDPAVGDALCGGFLSWRTAGRLRAAGVDPELLGAQRVERLALFAGEREADVALPAPGFGISRRALDGALRERALASGARLMIDRIRSVVPGEAVGEQGEHRAETIFLATGKHDVRGQVRPRPSADPALGLRIRIPAHERLGALLAGRIELHLFAAGYAGVVLQEDGCANVCLAVRKSLLAEAGGTPRDLLDRLGERYPAFGERLALAAPDLPIDGIGAVPYGWIARNTAPGLYRLGDQAAVVPSLAGEGMAIALASGAAAAEAWLANRGAPDFQRRFARRARRPMGAAGLIWRLAERSAGARTITGLVRAFPPLARLAMELTRLD